jgi:hypothetical protein
LDFLLPIRRFPQKNSGGAQKSASLNRTEDREVNLRGSGRLHQSRVEAMSAEEKQDASFNAAKQHYAE